MNETKNCRKTCSKLDSENKSALSIFVSSYMKKNFLRQIFKTQLFLKSCVTHEILLHQSIGVTLASVEHSDIFSNYFCSSAKLLLWLKRRRKLAPNFSWLYESTSTTLWLNFCLWDNSYEIKSSKPAHFFCFLYQVEKLNWRMNYENSNRIEESK